MKKLFLIVLLATFLSSCSNVTTGFEMIGEFTDSNYVNDFSIDSRYWPSLVMVIPENTDLEGKKLEAVAIFNDYGIMNEQDPVGYNISHFTQNGINTQRKTIFAIEDNPDVSLFLDDACAESVAYSIYDDSLELFELYIQEIDGGNRRLVASGDGDKLNSYASVVGEEIFWTEIKGDEFFIYRESLDGDKEEVIYYPNAYGFLLESNGPYISFYVEEFDDDYSLLSNEVFIFDINSNEIIKSFDVYSDLELISGNYDGKEVFVTAYDYAYDEYLYARMDRDGELEYFLTSEDNDLTFTGCGSRAMGMEAMAGGYSDYYEAEVYNFETEESDFLDDLLNAGFYNGYLFYVECAINSNGLINDISLYIENGK